MNKPPPTAPPRSLPTISPHGAASARRPRMLIPIAAFLCILGKGCAFHYYDAKTGIEHLWGIGHVRNRVAPASDGVRALATSKQILGLGVGAGPADRSITLGWSDSQRLFIADDTAIALHWPDHDFFKVQAGTRLDSLTATDTGVPVSNAQPTPP